MDECEKLSARILALEAKFRRRAERARDERDIATMVRMRDAARVANEKKAEVAAVAGDLAADLARAQAEPTEASLDALMTRLDATVTMSLEIASTYEAFVEWEAEPS
jgi:DNA-binding helix-hairpin-helix protein with protein kinase domain